MTVQGQPGGVSGLRPAEEHSDDARIIHAARADLTQFAPLYERYFPRIYAYCLRRVEHRHAAEDLTSAIFTRALKGLHEYRDGSVAAWLFRIAHNVVANHYRGRRPQLSLEETDSDLAADHPSLIENILQDEQSRIIRGLVAALPDNQREMLSLKLDGGLTAEEIGAALGKSAGAVRVELHRIIKRLRARYEEEHRA